MIEPQKFKQFSAGVFLVLLFAAWSCEKSTKPLVLLVPDSLTPGIEEIAMGYSSGFFGKTTVQIEFVSSVDFNRQVDLHELKADIILSDGLGPINRLIRNKTILPDHRVLFGICNLTVFTHPKLVAPINTLQQLAANKSLSVGMASEKSLAGLYTKIMLENADVWKAIHPQLHAFDSQSDLIQAVMTGQVDVGIAYSPQVAKEPDAVTLFEMMYPLVPPITLSAGIIASTTQQQKAIDFLGYLTSKPVERLLKKWHYRIERPDASAGALESIRERSNKREKESKKKSSR